MARFFIHRPVFAIVVSLVILLAGLVSIPSLPISQYPQIVPPVIQVTANYQGASAEVLEQTVAAPIEQQVNGAEGMLYMRSMCTNSGTYILQITFDLSRDQDLAMVDVQNRVNQANPLLPPDVVKAGVTVKKQSTQSLLYISFYSPDESKDTLFISNYATINIIDQLARIPGVGLATIAGGERDYSMRLWIRPDKLAKLQVTADDISQAIQSQNVQAAAGSIGDEPQPPGQQMTWPVKVKGRLDQPAEFENIIVRTEPDGAILRVKDVARTELGAQTYNTQGTRNNKPSVIVAVYQLPDANGVQLAQQVRAKLAELAKDFPQGMEYEVTFDTTVFVTKSIHEVIETLFEAIVLVLIVVFVFLGNFRATLIPMLAVPVSLVGTFAGLAALGFSINLLTLFGLVLAVGIVVDDAIVVVEAVEHHIEHGLSPIEATERAMEEVSGPVVAIALVLCSVFVPVAFLGGITGSMYRQFAVTLSVSVLLSATVALTLTPALCTMILREKKPMRGPLGWFLAGFNKLFGWATTGYLFVVHRAIRWFLVTLVLLGSVYYGAYFLSSKLPTGFIPPEDMGYFMVNVTLPSGASLQRTTQVASQASELAGRMPGVDKVLGILGYNIVQGTTSSNNAALIVILKDWDERKSPDQRIRALILGLQAQLNQIPEAQFQAFNPPAIPGLGTTGGVTMELQDRSGGSIPALAATTADFITAAQQTGTFRIIYTLFNPNIPMLDVQLDRDKVQVLGIPVNQAFTAMQINLGGYFVNQFNKFGRTWRVYLQAESQFRRKPEDIGGIYLRSSTTGGMVPLSTVTRVRGITGPDVLIRYNLYRATEVNGEAAAGKSSGQAIEAMEQLARSLPDGYGFEWTSMAYQEKLSSGQTGMILALGLTFVFLFLAAQYESWGVPFSVLLGIPTVALGALAGMVLIRMDVNIYVQIGMLMLVGLAAKNAILIVEFAKEKYEKEGLGLVEAAMEGAHLRFRPILMTSFAFIMGVIPLATADGASATCRRALGTAVLTGMGTATLLGVFLIPALYVYVQFLVNKLGGDPRKKKGPAAPPPPPPPPPPPEPAPVPVPAPPVSEASPVGPAPAPTSEAAAPAPASEAPVEGQASPPVSTATPPGPGPVHVVRRKGPSVPPEVGRPSPDRIPEG